jgi:capsid protein
MKPQLVNKFGKPLGYSQHYKATQQHRERKYIPAVAADSNQTLSEGTRREIIGLSRFLFNNSSICRGAVTDISKYSIGSGLTAQSLADPKVQTEYEDYFNRWAEICDAQDRLSLDQMQYLASLAIDRDGDIGIALSKTATGMPKINLVESHRICNDYRDESYCDGIRHDRYGKVTGYKIKNGEGYRTFAPRDFILLHDIDRVCATRGTSSLAPVINTLATVDELLEYEAVGVKVSSSIGVVITSPQGEQNDGSSFIEDGFTSADTGGLAQDTWSSGMIPRLAEGESIESLSANRPAATFNGFIEHLIKSLSVGLGVPYEFLWSPAGLNAGGQRFILKKAERTFLRRQTLISNKMMKRLWGWVIATGIKNGELAPDDNWHKCRFIGEKMPSIDLGRDAAQTRADILLGVKSLADVQLESGKSWEATRKQTYVEADNLLSLASELSNKHEITLDAAVALLSARTSTGYPIQLEEEEEEQA